MKKKLIDCLQGDFDERFIFFLGFEILGRMEINGCSILRNFIVYEKKIIYYFVVKMGRLFINDDKNEIKNIQDIYYLFL